MKSVFNDMRKQINREHEEPIHLQGQVDSSQG